MTPPSSTNEISLDDFSKEFKETNREVRAHWKMGREAARNVGEKLNELVRILHKENPDWSVKKIAKSIWIANEDLEGFSTVTIYNNLDAENKALLDLSQSHKNSSSSRNIVLEQSGSTLNPKVLEQSSSGADSDTEMDELEASADEILKEAPKERTTQQQEDVIYDPNLLNKHIKEIARLQEENAKLKIERTGTLGNKFDFKYDLEVKDQILPLIVTVFPDKKDGYVRLDKTRLKKD